MGCANSSTHKCQNNSNPEQADKGKEKPKNEQKTTEVNKDQQIKEV